jgi:regulator of protease activity HflC (stomatin/prohibitin superfamily)
VQVESYQNAVVYRLGHLQEEFLEPGLHFVFPYPFDKVEVYDTGVIQKTTIGYRSEESGDNIWTSAHDGEEYKLLLGSGDELVSINLRLEYQIKDLKEYLTKATAPEEVMKALAYELVTDETISTDLDALLSTDRKEFATTLKTQLTEQIDSMGIGLKIVNVVLESIHPPVEIASVYQELISAEITYDKNLLYAQGGAVKRIYSAEKTSNSLIQKAEAEKAVAHLWNIGKVVSSERGE